jgi:hypothetical protein
MMIELMSRGFALLATVLSFIAVEADHHVPSFSDRRVSSLVFLLRSASFKSGFWPPGEEPIGRPIRNAQIGPSATYRGCTKARL